MLLAIFMFCPSRVLSDGGWINTYHHPGRQSRRVRM